MGGSEPWRRTSSPIQVCNRYRDFNANRTHVTKVTGYSGGSDGRMVQSSHVEEYQLRRCSIYALQTFWSSSLPTLAMESISSKKRMHGAAARALSNSSRTFASDSPNHMDKSSGPGHQEPPNNHAPGPVNTGMSECWGNNVDKSAIYLPAHTRGKGRGCGRRDTRCTGKRRRGLYCCVFIECCCGQMSSLLRRVPRST